METSNEMHRTPWRPLTALGVAAGLLLSGCAADERDGGSPDPGATSISEQEPDNTRPEAPVDNGDDTAEKLWANIGRVLDDPSTPQPKGGTYDEFANSLGYESRNDGVITIDRKQYTCTDIAELTTPNGAGCSINSNRQQIFSVYGPKIEKWLAESQHIPEDMPKHVAVTLALNIAEDLMPNSENTRPPHEALVGLEVIRLENANNYGYTMDLEGYTKLYADWRYNGLEIGEQPPATIEEWQSGQVESNLDPVAEPVTQSEALLEPGSLASKIAAEAGSLSPDSSNTVDLDGLVYGCEDLLGSCEDADRTMLAAVEKHAAELRKSGVEEIVAVPVAFLMMRAVDQDFAENYDVRMVVDHLGTPVNDTAVPIHVEDFEAYAVGQRLGLWEYPDLVGGTR